MKKPWKIAVSIIFGILMTVFVLKSAVTFYIGDIYLMDENGERMSKQETIAKIKDSEDKIIEIIKWNYNVDSVTFARTKGSSINQSKVLPEVALYPMGSIGIQGYVNGDKGYDFVCKLGSQRRNSGDPNYIDASFDSLSKNPSPLPYGKRSAPENYYLKYEDIQKLKKQGFTSDITFEEIKQYFENKETTNDELKAA